MFTLDIDAEGPREAQEAATRAVRNALRRCWTAETSERISFRMLRIPTVLDALRIPRTTASDDADPRADFFDEAVPAKQGRSWRELVRSWFLAHAGEPAERVGAIGAPYDGNLRLLARELRLDRTEAAILRILVLGCVNRSFGAFLALFPVRSVEDAGAPIAAALGADLGEVQRRLSRDGTLLASGLVRLEEDEDAYGFGLTLDRRVPVIAGERRARRETLLERFLAVEPPPTLALDDFTHLGPQIGAVTRLLGAALDRRERGVNVLLYGASGAGKTELARVVARELGARLFLAGAADSNGNNPSAHERLASRALAERLLASGRALTLFDELEDLFERAWPFGASGPRMSKLFFARVLETNAVPTIFTANDIGHVDPAFLRRFTLTVRFRELGEAQRRRVWGRVAGEELSTAERDARAAAYDVSPAEIASSVRAARLAGGGAIDRRVLDVVLEAAVRVVPGRGRARPADVAGDYRPDAVNASVDLARLTERLAAWVPGAGPGLTLCLHGPPGTGKSRYVAHLAERMGRRLVVRHASDIESCWVGETEKNIASAFGDAEDDEAVLLFDEVDTFLRDRRTAVRGFELSRVNEFLQRLEAHRGVVACTTNLVSELDPAALRRFVVKVAFRPLRPEQTMALFDAHLAPLVPDGRAEARQRIEGRLRRMSGLVPGDFAVVARRFLLEGAPEDPEALLRALEDEVRGRGREGRAIGF